MFQPQRAKLQVGNPENYRLCSLFEVDWCIRKVPRAQNNAARFASLKPSADESATVLDKEQSLGRFSARFLRRDCLGAKIHPNDASRQHIRKGKSILRSDLHIAEVVLVPRKQRIERVGRGPSEPATEWDDDR